MGSSQQILSSIGSSTPKQALFEAVGGGAGGRPFAGSGAGAGGNGCVRIIWGSGRAFPSTRTLDE